MNISYGQNPLPPDANALLVEIPAGVTDKRELFGILAERLAFPSYFGMNWDALEECLEDLSWLHSEFVVLMHQDLPLAAKPNECRTYLSILHSVDVQRRVNKLVSVFPNEVKPAIEKVVSAAVTR